MSTTCQEKRRKERYVFLSQAGNRLGIETSWLTAEITVNHQAEILLSCERLDQRKFLSPNAKINIEQLQMSEQNKVLLWPWDTSRGWVGDYTHLLGRNGHTFIDTKPQPNKSKLPQTQSAALALSRLPTCSGWFSRAVLRLCRFTGLWRVCNLNACLWQPYIHRESSSWKKDYKKKSINQGLLSVTLGI